MIAPEDPPGFLVRTEAQKAAWDNGFRLERGVENGGWLHYVSTTARGEIWIAGAPPRGPWLLSIDHPGVAVELATLPPSPLPGPGLVTFRLDTLTALHAALDRVYKLGVSLPEAPLARFRARAAALPQTTEAERLVVQRIGQDIFRAALMDYWGGRCPITGITDPALLRASHIVPWAECDDAQRLDVHNGLLLSALWDAAFDAGLVSFANNGTILSSPELSAAARTDLRIEKAPRLPNLREAHRTNLGAALATVFRCVDHAPFGFPQRDYVEVFRPFEVFQYSRDTGEGAADGFLSQRPHSCGTSRLVCWWPIKRSPKPTLRHCGRTSSNSAAALKKKPKNSLYSVSLWWSKRQRSLAGGLTRSFGYEKRASRYRSIRSKSSAGNAAATSDQSTTSAESDQTGNFEQSE
jgi:hypothetical protein